MLDVTTRILENRGIMSAVEHSEGGMLPEQNERWIANRAFFAREASESARDKFGPYLDFSAWR